MNYEDPDPNAIRPAAHAKSRWYDVLPYDVAKRHTANERARAVKRAYETGITYREIAEVCGVTPAQIAYYYHRDKKRERLRTPVETYFADISDVRALAGLGFVVTRGLIERDWLSVRSQRKRKLK